MSDVDQFREDQRWVQPDFGHAYDGIAVVAEAPSTQEIRQGKNLVGPSGSINWQFAARYARLDRSRVYVTNWRKIPLTDFEKKHLSAEEKEAWSQALRDEIEAVGPRLVIAMGGYAVKALLGSEYSLEWANGLPCRAAIGSLETTVVPVVHPAAQPDGPFFERSESRRGFACVEHFRPIAAHERAEARRQRRDAGQMLKKIQRDTLGG